MSEINIILRLDNNRIQYIIGGVKDGTFINTTGNQGEFTKDLQEIITQYHPDFLKIYTEYNKYHSGIKGMQNFGIQGVNMLKNMFTTKDAKIAPTQQNDSLLDQQQQNALKGLLGGKKTKSRRSHNSNKTLKNRK